MPTLIEESTPSFAEFPVWASEAPRITKPTRLFNIRPIAMGSGEVESLSGYLARVAEAHCVSPIRLIIHSTYDQAKLPFTLRTSCLAEAVAVNVNGHGDVAMQFSALIAEATGSVGVDLTTLLPWKELLSNMYLLKRKKAWCSVCYQEQLNQLGFNYEKLLWCVEGVLICPDHKCHLEQICRYCLKEQKLLSGKSRPGFCSSCLRWLGHQLVEATIDRAEYYEKDLWIAAAVRNLLSVSSNVDPTLHTVENFYANVQRCVDQVSYGSINNFAHITGIWHVTVRRLLKGQISPTLRVIQQICSALDIPLENLLLGPGAPLDLGGSYIAYASGVRNQFQNRLPVRPEDDESVVRYLKNLLIAMPPVSGRRAAADLGWRDTRLYQNFPILYQKIVERYKRFHAPTTPSDDEVIAVLCKAQKETPPPSLQSVLRSLGCKDTGYKLQKKFAYHCSQISQNFKSYRNKLNMDEVELAAFFSTLLNEDPPPSISEVSRRLEISRSHFRKKFPELRKILRSRCQEHANRRRNERLDRIESEIRAAVSELVALNAYPSEDKIKARLSAGCNGATFKRILVKVRTSTPF